jgi:hypothetical protein
MLLHSGPLGLVQCLLNAEPLPFGIISTEDRKLMQLKTDSEGHPRAWAPTYSHLTVYSSPKVTRGKCNPIGTEDHRTEDSLVACMSW